MVGTDRFHAAQHGPTAGLNLHLRAIPSERAKRGADADPPLHHARRRAGAPPQSLERFHGSQRDERLPGTRLGDEHPVRAHVEQVARHDGSELTRQIPHVDAHGPTTGRPDAVQKVNRRTLGPHQLADLAPRLLRPGSRELRLEVREQPLPAHA